MLKWSPILIVILFQIPRGHSLLTDQELPSDLSTNIDDISLQIHSNDIGIDIQERLCPQIRFFPWQAAFRYDDAISLESPQSEFGSANELIRKACLVQLIKDLKKKDPECGPNGCHKIRVRSAYNPHPPFAFVPDSEYPPAHPPHPPPPRPPPPRPHPPPPPPQPPYPPHPPNPNTSPKNININVNNATIWKKYG